MKLTKLLVLISIMLAFGASQGFAYFTNGDLIQVVYNPTTNVEVATDLGAIGGSTLVKDYSGGTAVVLADPGNITLSMLGASSWSDLSIGFVSYDPKTSVSTRTYYFATTSTTAPGINSPQRTNFQSAFASVKDYYASLSDPAGSAKTVTGSTTNGSSYYLKENSGGTSPGAYANLNGDAAHGEATLGDLSTTGYVDMYLYEYNNSGVLQAGPDANTPYIAVLRIMANGSTVLPPSVPIPASILLFGTGLLGFFGLRRKEAAV